MKNSSFKATVAFGFAMLAMNAYADQGSGGKGMDMGGMKMDCTKSMKADCMASDSTQAKAQATSMSDGVVKFIDKTNNSITLKHGAIDNMHMGPMTMAFALKDPAQLSKVKVGDKVKFHVENVNDIATITLLIIQK